MFRNLNSRIVFDIPAHFCRALFKDERTKPSYINGFCFLERIFYLFKKCFQRYKYIYLGDTCFLSNVTDHVCLSHKLIWGDYNFFAINKALCAFFTVYFSTQKIN